MKWVAPEAFHLIEVAYLPVVSMGGIDYHKIVQLVAPGEDDGGPERWGTLQWGGTVHDMPLWRAVVTVIVEWVSSDRQRDAEIVCDGGTSLKGLAAIRAIYDREDFPAKGGWE